MNVKNKYINSSMIKFRIIKQMDDIFSESLTCQCTDITDQSHNFSFVQPFGTSDISIRSTRNKIPYLLFRKLATVLMILECQNSHHEMKDFSKKT